MMRPLLDASDNGLCAAGLGYSNLARQGSISAFTLACLSVPLVLRCGAPTLISGFSHRALLRRRAVDRPSRDRYAFWQVELERLYGRRTVCTFPRPVGVVAIGDRLSSKPFAS
jgi:hypothetical protein